MFEVSQILSKEGMSHSVYRTH